MARDLRGIVDKIVDLPTLPQVVTAIMGLIEDPDSSAKDIEGVMGNDPALVAKILKLVNSPFYGLANRVSSIQQAIAILGFNTIKSLAISASVFDLFGDVREDFSYEEFWAHSFGCATVSSFVAKREPQVNSETAFVLGLLHGMGKVVLDQYAPVEFGDILDIGRTKSLSFAEAEKEVLETSYADLGFWLAAKWKLAEEVQIAIQFQDRISECPEEHRPTASTLAFSKYVCRMKAFGSAADFDKPSLPREAWETLTIDKEELPSIISEINAEIEKTKAFLEVIR